MSGLFYADRPRLAEQVDAFFGCHEPLGLILAQRLQADFAGLELGLPHDQGETGPALVGSPQLSFETGRGRADGKLQARQALAKLLGELEGEAALGVAGGDEVRIGRGLRRRRCPRPACTSTTRSMPSAQPTAGVSRPPSCATSPS